MKRSRRTPRPTGGPRRRLQLGSDSHLGIPWRKVLTWGGAALVIILLILRFFVIEVVVVEGNRMAPNLLDGDAFTVHRLPDPALGDVVLIESEGRVVLRRVVGLAGDRIGSDEGQLIRNEVLVETRAEGSFAYLDPVEALEGATTRPPPRTQRQRLVGERLDAAIGYATLGDYLATAQPWAIEIPETEVPPLHVFVLCDNRRVCELGGLSGVVPVDWISGVVGSVLWTGTARITPPTTPP